MKKFLFLTLFICLFLTSCEEKAPTPSNVPVIMTEILADGKDKSEHIKKEDERITLTSLDVWDEFNFDGNFSDNCLLFLRGFIEGYSEFLEFATVKISNWEIIRDTKVYGYKMAFNFTVTESKMDSLPIGDYKTIITDSVDCYMEFLEAPRENASAAVPQTAAETAIFNWLTFAQYYDFAKYGEWNAPLFAHYIRCHYGDDGVLTFADFAKLSKDKFGTTVTKEMFASQLYVDDMTLYINTSASDENQSFDIIEEYTNDDVTTVVVQHYADCNKFIKSYKIAYYLDSEERFLYCEILNTAPYKPYGLRSVK